MLSDGWLPPNMIYPPGLEYLMDLDYLFVNQKSVTFREGEHLTLPRDINITLFFLRACANICIPDSRSSSV